MLNVGLTGNAGAGKTTVSEMFAAWGATVIDADQIVRELQAPGQPLVFRIAEALGSLALREDGSLNRDWVRQRIVEDPRARDTLNGLVHPAVQQRLDEVMRGARDRGDEIVVNDIPLLFEVLDPGQFDVVVLVDAPATTRMKRLIARGLDEPQARALMATQLDPTVKRERSDFVIDNNGTMEELRTRAAEVWSALKRRAAGSPSDAK